MKTVKINFNFFSHFFAVQFFCLIFAFAAQSQENQSIQNFHQWGAVTIFNGLPSDNVRAIAQTSDGVLWFGGENGLARFDGRRVQTSLLEANKILALETAPDGTLWVGTNIGAFRLKDNKFELLQATKDFAVTDFLFNENIFLATENGVILKLDGSNIEKIPAENLLDSKGNLLKITSLAKSGNKIIAGTQSRSVLIFENNLLKEKSFPPYFINALAQNADGKIWLGADARISNSGFFSFFDNDYPNKISAETGNVSAIAPVRKGVWVGTSNNGLFYFENENPVKHYTFENTSGGLRSNTIYTLFVDREEVIWIGTNRGVSRFDASSPAAQILSEDSNANFVRTFFRTSDGKIFAGTNRGLYVFADGNWLEAGNFSNKTIYAVSENEKKQILFGTPNELLEENGKQILAGDVRAVVNFRGKTYAAIFGRGLTEIAGETLVFQNDAITSLFADGEKIFIGTGKDGVFLFDGIEARQENSLELLRGAAIWKITKDAENNLWFGSENGFFLFKNGVAEQIISNQKVRDFVFIGTDIWAATTENGLLHLKKDEIFGWISSNLNVKQGLPSEQIFALLKHENRLFIGTNRGAAIYAPSAIEPKIVAVRVLSQRLHSAEEIAGKINLEYPQNSLLTEVSGLSSRTFPEQFQYGFLLKNAKGEILEKRLSNEVQFAPTNLEAGEYSVQVRAFNKDLLASAPLEIRFSVARAPFPWTTLALGVLLVIALIALVWAIFERFRIVQKNRELATAKFDLANEAERERKRIARDLHDQTLADLRNLMLKSDKFSPETSEFRTEIEAVSTEIRRICEDLSPSVLENVGLIAALEFLLSHTIENYKFFAAENLEEKLNFAPNAQMQIYRIAQEILNNIKRHSDAKFVEMTIEISPENQFILQITDDGKPFNPTEKTTQGRGIANIISRAALIEAEAVWETAETGKTIFKLWKSTAI